MFADLYVEAQPPPVVGAVQILRHDSVFQQADGGASGIKRDIFSAHFSLEQIPSWFERYALHPASIVGFAASDRKLGEGTSMVPVVGADVGLLEPSFGAPMIGRI